VSFPRYPSYKDSGAKWLGEVPSHWGVKPMWTFFRRVKRVGFESEQLLSVYRDYGVIPKASRDDNFNKPSDDLSVYQLVVPGDLAINKMKAWQGSVAVSDCRGIVSPAYFIYEALHDSNRRFLHHLFRSPRYIGGYLSHSKGIRPNQWDLEPEVHSRFPVLVPPPAEQTTIAEFLDRETGKIDELVAEQRRLMELLKEKRQAVISHAVTRGLNPAAPLKPSGIEWLGDVPAHWHVVALKHLVSRPIIDGPHETPIKRDEGTPFVSAEAVSQGWINFDKIWGYISPEDHAEYSKRYKPKRGDILLVKLGATTGTPAIVDTDDDFNIWVPLAAIRPKADIEPRFILHVLRSDNLKIAYELNWTYGTQQTLGLRTISNLLIPMPPKDEREAIVKHLDSILPLFESLTAEAQRAIDLLQERRTALISAAVTGQIDVRAVVA
jgi:type I restriction enzyme, S subunit